MFIVMFILHFKKDLKVMVFSHLWKADPNVSRVLKIAEPLPSPSCSICKSLYPCSFALCTSAW